MASPLHSVFFLLWAATLSTAVSYSRDTLFDVGWRFFRGDDYSAVSCHSSDFPVDLGNLQCLGLQHALQANSPETCQAACCQQQDCETWQFCADSASCSDKGCWTGKMANCQNSSGWISRARSATPLKPTCTSSFCQPSFDDSSWNAIDLPHDWSSLDLPPRDEDRSTPTLGLRYGSWLFHAGDGSFSMPDVDDSHWQLVKGGEDWRVHSNLTGKNASGWYRQHFNVQDFQVNASTWNPNGLILSLGLIAGSDETYLNGQKLGTTGSIDKPDPGDYVNWRRYAVPAGLLHSGKNSPNVVAVRVRSLGGAGSILDGGYPGGFFDDPELKTKDVRSGPFDAGTSPGGRSTGFTVGGVGWYRKTFQNPAVWNGYGRVSLRFDGVYEHADVYMNGALLGKHPYGYTTFEYDVTDHLVAKDNVLAVKVNNFGRNSRWYSGSGIYRHVWLTVIASPVYIPQWGVYVYTPEVKLSAPGKASEAKVAVAIKVKNALASPANAKVSATIVGPSGAVVATPVGITSVPAGEEVEIIVSATLTGKDLSLWSPDSPSLYTASAIVSLDTTKTSLDTGNNYDIVDEVNQTFGIRSLEFSPDRGFLINGVETKLQGGCVHHDNGPLGSRTIDRAEERRVEILKANGYNAIRTSHNPVSPAFLDACDRLGVMVMDEAFDCWEQGKNTDDYHVDFDAWWQRDVQALVLRDRNHPSVIMWSIGNEIPMRDSTAGFNLSHVLSDYVRSMDPFSGRPITAAVPGVHDGDDGFFKSLDVAGYNYSPNKYVSDHQRIPERIMVGTESFPTESFHMWDLVWNNSWVIGDFIWTAMDYIGETRIGFESSSENIDEVTASGPFSWHVSFCGDIDIVGHQKPQSLYRNALWGVSPLELMVHRPMLPRHNERVGGWGFPDQLPSWSWPGHEAESLNVVVYSNSKACPNVTLSLNGKDIGTQPIGMATQITAAFSVPYSAGTLTARCPGTATPIKSLITVGDPSALKLSPDRAIIRADTNDLSYVTVEVVDAQGARVPEAAIDVSFKIISGPARLAAVGSGDPQDISSFQSSARTTWQGRAVAIVQPLGETAGEAVLQASAIGKVWTTKITIGAAVEKFFV